MARVLLRVGVDDEVVEVVARALPDHEAGLLQVGHRGRRHHLDPVQLAALQRGDLGVVGAEELQPEAVDVRLGAVEPRVALEQHDLLGRVLDQGERAAGDDRGRVGERGQRLAVARRVLGPDVLGQDRHLLQLGQHVGHRLLVGEHHGGGVGRRRALHVRHVAGRVGGRAVLELEDGAVGPGRVGGGQRLAVGPLGVGLGVERPDPPAVALLPAAREVRHELQAAVVLHQVRVDDLERRVGVFLERDERVERVDAGRAAQPVHAAVRRPAVRAGATGGGDQGHGGEGYTESAAERHLRTSVRSDPLNSRLR